MQEVEFVNWGCIIQDIPKDLFEVLRKESENLESRNNLMTSGLTGSGVTKHYYMNEETKPQFFNFIQSLQNDYLSRYPNYLKEFRMLSHDCAFRFGNPWYNVQQKGEFIPNHVHDGLLSYSAWIKIPYDLDQERKTGDHASCFEFRHTTILGTSGEAILPISKDWEGKIAMFPSALQHCVYPFQTVDDTRISLSGNIVLDTENSRIN
jgi:hypothetical protein